jgi:hypothetical protein
VALANVLAKQPVEHSPNTTRTYHAMMAGLHLNELVQRVDPQQRTIGRIIREVRAV